MYVTKIFFWLTLFFHLAACSSTGSPGKDNNAKNAQDWKVLISERQCAVSVPREELIKTQADFDRIWEQTFKDTDYRPEKPVVNFSEKWIIASYLGEVNTGGHEIELKEIKTGKDLTTIIVKHIKPGPGCMNSMAIEYPFIMVAVSHFSPDKVEFKTLSEEQKCE